MAPQCTIMILFVLLLAGPWAHAGPGLGGDYDSDGEVDLDDYRHFPACHLGPQGGLANGCEVFDFDGDDDVDLQDCGALQLVFATFLIPDMVEVPGGTFEMGDHNGTGQVDELPVHSVLIDAFRMDVYEITNREYARFLNSAYGEGSIDVAGGVVYLAGRSIQVCATTGSEPTSRITWDGATFGIVAEKHDHPMVHVTWFGTTAYANWRSVRRGRQPCYNLTTWACDFAANGYRLPTEAEWEYAARGGEHAPYYEYPWGDEIDGSKANYAFSGDPFETGPYPWTSNVGYFNGGQSPPGVDMANGYGLYDIAGNAWEWCHDWYDGTYYGTGLFDNPRGPDTGWVRVNRGGSWYYADFASRCANRDYDIPEYRDFKIGFRLVTNGE